MTDRQRLLFSLMSDPDSDSDGGITVLDVVALLYEVGAEHRRAVHDRRLVGAAAG